MSEGNSDKTVIPEVMLNSTYKYKIWQIGYITKKDFMVRVVYTGNEETDPAIEETKTPDKYSSKRKLKSPDESTLNQRLE